MYDELELDKLGDRKTALFLIMSDTDSTFNFLISMIYTQLFNLLCDKADDQYGGKLPVHVRCLIDECANIGQIPQLEKLVATIRSREISACLVLQTRSQLKAIYKDNADTIVGNMDSQIFLGGSEPTTLKDLAEALGKETIDSYNNSDTRGNSPSYGTNYQKLGHDPQDPDDLAATFSDVERQFYETHYTAFVESQNDRNAKIRHTERNRSIPDMLSSRKTCPEETIYQLGTKDDHASAEDLLNIVTEFIEEFKAKYGEHVHVLDWALHLDESTPHIHERHVFDCENKYGEIAPQQEKALEALGFNLPDPAKPLSRRNNRKITFDAACRKMLFEIAKRHGLELEEEAEYGNRKYLEKQDFILAKQKEQLAAQQSKLDELTLKVSDMETLLEDVSAAAYDKAVEVVTDVVRTETRKEDMRMIEDTKKWVLSPERKAPQATREYAAHRLDTVLDKFLKTMQTTAARLQEKLLKPETRQKGKEQVKEKARDSVLQLLSRLHAEQTQRKPSVPPTAEKSETRGDVY